MDGAIIWAIQTKAKMAKPYLAKSVFGGQGGPRAHPSVVGCEPEFAYPLEAPFIRAGRAARDASLARCGSVDDDASEHFRSIGEERI